MPDSGQLTIILQGGSSAPLHEVAGWIEQALTAQGMNVTVQPPEEMTPEWRDGWDGLLTEETVVIREGEGNTTLAEIQRRMEEGRAELEAGRKTDEELDQLVTTLGTDRFDSDEAL